MMNFHVKLGTINYQGCLITGTGTGYRWGKNEYPCFGAVIVAIQEARTALAKSIRKAI